VLDVELPIPNAANQFDAEGELTDGEIRDRLASFVGDLVDHTDNLLSTAIS
jgi:hypothetical protein